MTKRSEVNGKNGLETRLNAAAQSAANRLAQFSGQPIPAHTRFLFPDDPRFRAYASKTEGYDQVVIHTGVMQEVDRFWRELRALAVYQRQKIGGSQPNQNPLNLIQLADLTIEWLVLHELMHLRDSHVDLIDGLSLFEIEEESAKEGADSQFGEKFMHQLSGLSHTDVRRCLEISADSDATRLHLGAFDLETSDALRQRAASTFVAMALINQHSSKRRSTHPGANTRFFLVFALLFQMWLQPNTQMSSEKDDVWLRRTEELDAQTYEAFVFKVIKPCVDDAAEIAHLAGAQAFINDMRGDGALFYDIQTVQYADELSGTELKTKAAKEWFELRGVAQALRQALGQTE